MAARKAKEPVIEETIIKTEYSDEMKKLQERQER